MHMMCNNFSLSNKLQKVMKLQSVWVMLSQTEKLSF